MFPKPRKPLSINRMIPNILTLLALCAGLTALRYGLGGQWEKAMVSVAIAALLDGLDGRVARLLRGTSKFGAELDSLSDFLCFGVTPAVLLYLWTMQSAGAFGWAAVLVYSVCAALRLARFNTMLEEDMPPPWMKGFFTGLSAPAGAGVALLPMMLSLQNDPGFFDHPVVVGVFLIGVALLMVSTVPMYSFKTLKLSPKFVLPMMLTVGLAAAFFVSEPLTTLSVMILAYLVSIPFAYRSCARLRAKMLAEEHNAPPPAAPVA
ncbi:MAG: CDP-diacylglycerol O-phosphatidyltransferase [Alphaproteobacteria bacterium RIFOXYD12_FULL_60_8]|nr:MAG: CDP-diacylglycerol O-phosphatidyltransferase [Alphaproteobacteria bacterium RIFOXYD12_FULL_60_8]